MNNKELEWFEALNQKRKKVLSVIKDPEYQSVFNEAIDKYSDSAHFVYELLQNADDAEATRVEMILEKDKFIFKHNGTERFTVSDPELAEKDRRSGKYGHINSITAIGFSTKNERTGDDNKIGKFGVGFKAIFQYTRTPYIYDDNINFIIKDYIVPYLIEDTIYVEKNKTVFVFPFNHPDVPKEKCYEDISKKIKSLSHPTLFLSYLRFISWSIGSEKGVFSTEISESYSLRNIIAERISVFDINNKSQIWMFSKRVKIKGEGHHIIKAGLYVDKGRINTQIRPMLHCFFPTKETIQTCFILHAPFALANNREQIKKDHGTNYELMSYLEDLMADALVCLREIGLKKDTRILNDNIIDIINVKVPDNDFYGDSCLDREESIHETFIDMIREEPLLLSREGNYVDIEHAVWANADLQKLLSTEQLNSLIKDRPHSDKAMWGGFPKHDRNLDYSFVLCSRTAKDKDLIDEILDCGNAFSIFDNDDFASRITESFMLQQDEKWLDSFYQLVIKNRLTEVYSLNLTQKSKGILRYKPIIRLENGSFVSPYLDEGHLNVFFRSEGVSFQANYIDTKLYNSSHGFRDLLKKLEVGVPDRSDYIFSQVIAKYSDVSDENSSVQRNPIKDLEEIYLYWKSCTRECAASFIENVNMYLELKDQYSCYRRISSLYRPDCHLKEYLEIAKCENIFIFNESFYKTLEDKYGIDNMSEFFDQLDFIKTPKIIQIRDIVLSDVFENNSRIPSQFLSGERTTHTIQGLKEFMVNTFANNGSISQTLSHYIWNKLLSVYSESNLFDDDKIEYHPNGNRRRSPYITTVSNSLAKFLNSYAWIYNSNTCEFQKPSEIYLEDMIESGYVVNNRLIEVFDILSSPRVKDKKIISTMSEETQITYSLGESAKKYFEDEDEMLEAKQALEEKKAKERERLDKKKVKSDKVDIGDKRKSQKNLDYDDFNNKDACRVKPNQYKRLPKSVNLEDSLAGFDEKAQITRDELIEVQNLRDAVENNEKYSYIWFKSLIELESRSNGSVESDGGKKTIFLKFDEVGIDYKSENIIMLKGCHRYIPTSIEDIEDINVSFYFINGLSQSVEFEAASVRENSLRLKVSNYNRDILDSIKKNINLISRAEINVDKPIELIEQWKRAINSLDFEDSYNLQHNIRSDIKFIFGPPGTGKTTELARTISDLINRNDNCRILVLAPTNKACDVLTRKLLDTEPEDDSWIWRFVTTMDPSLDEEEVVYSRDSDISLQDKVCVVSTIARFCFDGFVDWRLSEICWDYIIIDEASMIPLYQIMYPIYHCENSKIIIAGDPFQIDPIVKMEEWMGENIYTCVNLNDFKNPRTVPHQFEIQKLCTQYRSIPDVGEVYSRFAYDGILMHDRSNTSRKKLNMGFEHNSLNLVSFPVNGQTSLFEPKRIKNSNIHIYSVLFTYEFVSFILKNLNLSEDENVSIGIISPYGAEVSAIEKLCQKNIENNKKNVEIICGTAHGFQGDECDIVIIVMNPPASGMKLAKDKVFINKKNIMNVAISRARDYVFMLIPGKEYEFFSNMYEVLNIGRLMFETGNCKTFTSDNLEAIMYGNEMVIENSTFITSHQSTNIYSEAEEKYEIRIDENALDIQIKEN